MKTLLFIFLFQFSALISFSQEILNKWDKIEKHGWKEYKNDGYWVDYYSPDSSSLISLDYDSLNRLIGTITYSSDGGRVTSINDSTKTVRDYKANGTFTKFYDNYKVKLIGNCYLGNPIGIWIHYYPSGQIKRIENYPSDSLIYTLCKTYSTHISDIVVPINSEGEPTMFGTSSYDTFKSLPHGDWIEYYESGKIKFSKKFNMGLATGNWTWYYDNGKKMKEGQFFEKLKKYPCEVDTLTGYLNSQQEEDLMATESVIQLQPKHGKWQFWEESGKLILIEEYDKGKLIK